MGERYEWDSRKALENRRKHGVPFELVSGFDWDTALLIEDDDQDEARTIAVGWIGNRIYVLVYTLRGEKIRVISLRRAKRKERKDYHG